jgi:hypothetical protein
MDSILEVSLFMAYRVWIGNTPVDCETPEAALELARRIEGDSPAHPAKAHIPSEHSGSRWTEKRVNDFFRLIDGNQRKTIDALMEHIDGRTDQQLMTLLGYQDGRAIGGVFGALWKNAKKVGADPDDLYEKKPAMIGGRKAYEYFLKDSFRRAAIAARGQQ